VTQKVECLPHKHGALTSNCQKNKERKKYLHKEAEKKKKKKGKKEKKKKGRKKKIEVLGWRHGSSGVGCCRRPELKLQYCQKKIRRKILTNLLLMWFQLFQYYIDTHTHTHTHKI
jgi:hypothetical protein